MLLPSARKPTNRREKRLGAERLVDYRDSTEILGDALIVAGKEYERYILCENFSRQIEGATVRKHDIEQDEVRCRLDGKCVPRFGKTPGKPNCQSEFDKRLLYVEGDERLILDHKNSRGPVRGFHCVDLKGRFYHAP